MKIAVLNYNEIRPHVSIDGLTPCEAYSGGIMDVGQMKIDFIQARKDRIRVNLGYKCGVCG